MEPEEETSFTVLHRIRVIGIGAYALFAVYVLMARGFRDFVGLTCSAAVTMIAFLWLEEIAEMFLQPVPHVQAWRLLLRTLVRFVLLSVALTVTIVVARFDALSVLLGFSIVVVGIMGEAVYSTYRSFAG
jgi:hypothetical protein